MVGKGAVGFVGKSWPLIEGPFHVVHPIAQPGHEVADPVPLLGLGFQAKDYGCLLSHSGPDGPTGVEAQAVARQIQLLQPQALRS